MKKIFPILGLLLFVPCNTYSKVSEADNKSTVLIPGIEFNKCKDDEECIIIKTRGGVEYRIYSCGKLDKHIWKELNPNEDAVTISSSNIMFYTGPPSTEETDSLIKE